MKNLKEFMHLCDSDPVFDRVKNKGIGIPAFVHEDGTVTLLPEDVGLISRPMEGESCSIADRRKKTAADKASSGNNPNSRNASKKKSKAKNKAVTKTGSKSANRSKARKNAVVPSDAERAASTDTIISMIRENPSSTKSDFMNATGLSKISVTTILNHLKADGRLMRTGTRRSGQWVLVD